MKHRTRFVGLVILSTLAAVPAAAEERLDPTLTVVLGGGLSAGFANFHLTETRQQQAWPVLAVAKMGSYISVPTMRESGQAGAVNAYQPLAGLLPQVTQSGERALPFPFFTMNLSVPFLRVGDSLQMRPQPQFDGIKLISAIEGDIKTTLVNAILGGPLLTIPQPIRWSQAEYAQILNPTLTFIQMGFEDVSEAAVKNDPSLITSTASFTTDYGQLVSRMLLFTDATVVVMTVPDPTETAYFATSDELAAKYGLGGAELRERFGLAQGDVITLGGMVEISDALRGRRPSRLSQGSVLSASVAASVRTAVSGYNTAIRSTVQGSRAVVFDLADFLHQIKVSGTRTTSGQTVAGRYGEGFYSEDGIYPSPAGQALIANAVLQFLNGKYGTNYAPVTVPAQ